ncbi:MAG TPA: endonuclease/exonuclease/phosphatase family protein [Longimicrobiales bacterium]
MKLPPIFLSLTLTFWLGLYALRSYVPAAVWNLADELPLSTKPILAIVTNLIGIAGLFFFIKARRRALVPLAFAFALLTVSRQIFNSTDAVGPWLALASWICWIWLLAALAQETAAHDAERLLAPALASALALQLGMQSAWHGLDLHAVNGVTPIVLVSALAAALCAGVLRIPAAEARAASRTSISWLLLGPALFLMTTLGGNVGRFSELSRLSLPLAALLIQLALLLAVFLTGRSLSASARVVMITAAVAASIYTLLIRGAGAVLLLSVGLIVITAINALLDRRIKWSAATSIAATMLLFFGLLFGFYQSYEFMPLWTIALVPFAIATALPQRRVFGLMPGWWLPFALGGACTLLFLWPPPQSTRADGDVVTVLSYNIHHGFDDAGVPGMQRTARQIAALNPDLIALQEIGRGWTLLGGNDVVGYLRWRFPDYETVFEPTNGQLWGNAIMSRLPLSVATGGVFEAEPGVFRYGWVQAMIHLPGQHLEFYSVHLTADIEARGGNGRTAQARRLIEQIGRAPHVIVAGDFNAAPDDEPIRVMRAGLSDLAAEAGLGATATWPAGAADVRIDYVFARGFNAVGGRIPRTTASDHLPLWVQARLSDTTPAITASSNRR